MASALALFQFLIVDLGGQYTRRIAGTLQELGFRSMVLAPQRAAKFLDQHRPRGIIWSGGGSCVGDTDAPVPPRTYLGEVPILGICLGMHYLTQWLGGKLTKTVEHKEYGPRPLHIRSDTSLLLRDIPAGDALFSHGDSVAEVPPGFTITAETSDCPIAAMEDAECKLYGVQFHPEVSPTTHGKQMLANFAHLICGAEPDWVPGDQIAAIRDDLARQLPPDARVLLLYSGGVDSSVTAKLLSPLLADRLYGLTIDAGQLRLNELEQIRQNAAAAGLVNHHVADVTAVLAAALLRHYVATVRDAATGNALAILQAHGEGVHAERKRKIFSAVYAETARQFAARNGCTHWVQGTLATDRIESGALGGASVIKSHHNVGLDIGLPSIEPLASLFKYEVRVLGRALGLPAEITERMPFPGPGLLLRIIGTPVTLELLALLRRVDALAQEVVQGFGWLDLERMDQFVVALCGARTVGVKGDEREYGYPVIIRAVRTDDFMPARALVLPAELQMQLVDKLTQIPGITRVFFDPTPKPPATVELE